MPALILQLCLFLVQECQENVIEIAQRFQKEAQIHSEQAKEDPTNDHVDELKVSEVEKANVRSKEKEVVMASEDTEGAGTATLKKHKGLS